LPSTAEVIIVLCGDGGSEAAALGARLGDLRGGVIEGKRSCCCNNGFETVVAALAFNEDNSPEYEEKATVIVNRANSTSFFNISIVFLGI